ncbi:hypothetical protein [Aureimonas ureilytica]|uniref:hypothetical protein n=1 Tax=Aureimonas ureilytica TaxID=401562 RepID=UPI000375EA98|nr:hypothetical protein [Aureimonas ureilytica]
MTLNDYEKLRTAVNFAVQYLTVSLMFTAHPVARDYHNRALGELKAICKTITNVIDAQRAFDEAVDEAARETVLEDELLMATLTFDLATFHEAPIHLGDHLVIDRATDEFRIAPFGRWLPLHDNMPIVTRIPLRELDRFYDALKTLWEETGIEITAQEIQFAPVRRDG